jgi:hypothetical protein
MAEHGVFAAAGVWFGGYNLSCKLQSALVRAEVEVKDDTTVCDDTRSEAAGLDVVRFEGDGLFDSDQDGALYSNLSAVDIPLSYAIEGTTVGDRAYTFLAHQAQYELGGPITELLGYRLSANSRGSPLARGYVMASGNYTTTGEETGVQMGLLGSGEVMYAALHVTADNGTTLDVTVESDDNGGFTSAQTRITFAQVSGVGYEWKSLAGPIATDDYWRVAYTVVGTSWDFHVVVGIV